MKKILVVDDDPDFVAALRLRLETNQYQVVTAASGDEGLRKAESEKPDLIILDVMMPEVDGFTMTRALRAIGSLRSIPVIVITGKEGLRDLFEMECVKAYFTKPYDADELLQKIKTVLD